jgi:hypothetical protein|tara:strand:- start:231 stop:551 length:321 start_codon:yes stop_codon:yes gene_type:complete
MNLRAQMKDDAWVGDAVLGLFAREWLLEHSELEKQLPRQELFARLTSNQFLASFGEPTAVEAKIGLRYKEMGLKTCFDELEQTLIPVFKKQLLRKVPGGRRSGRLG